MNTNVFLPTLEVADFVALLRWRASWQPEALVKDD